MRKFLAVLPAVLRLATQYGLTWKKPLMLHARHILAAAAAALALAAGGAAHAQHVSWIRCTSVEEHLRDVNTGERGLLTFTFRISTNPPSWQTWHDGEMVRLESGVLYDHCNDSGLRCEMNNSTYRFRFASATPQEPWRITIDRRTGRMVETFWGHGGSYMPSREYTCEPIEDPNTAAPRF